MTVQAWVPTLVMCPPAYLSTKVPNNVFMGKGQSARVDVGRALAQYQRITRTLTALDQRVVEIPPTPGNQDQAYTANVAAQVGGWVVLAQYSAPGRSGEVAPAKATFERMGYQCVQPPYAFEGEADFKRVTPTHFIGGYGQFTDPRALQWIAETCGVTVTPVHEVSQQLYHLDCSLLVLAPDRFLVVEEGLDAEALRALRSLGEVILTPPSIPTTGITNGVFLPEKHVYLSGTLQPEVADYRKAMEWLLETMDEFQVATIFLDTDAFEPSGADLSCCVMHLYDPPTRGRRP